MESLVLALLTAQLLLAQTQLAHAQEINPIDTYREFAISEAHRRGIDEEAFIKTLECESGFDPTAIGDHGKSFGIAQIFLPAHSEITRRQAQDGYFSISWAALQFSLNKQSMWSCWRQLYTHKK